MRLIFALAVLVPVLSAPTGARAQDVWYPWCAHYGKGMEATNCGFLNVDQCRAAVSGVGGICSPNAYPPPGAAPAPTHPAKPRRLR